MSPVYQKKNRNKKIVLIDAVKIVSKENNETYLDTEIALLM